MNERFLVVEDHPIVQLGLRQLIAGRWPAAVVDVAPTLAEAQSRVASETYDIAVVDLNLPDAAGLDSVTLLRKLKPGLRLLVLSLNDEAAYAQRVLQLGASGYLSKERAAAELIQAMERIAEGKRYITVSQAERIAEVALGEADRAPHETLSMQEHRVMVYLAQGKRLTEIGELMHLSPKTITTYRARVLEKIGVDSNQALLKYCLSHGVSVG
ncbi:response regulator transcription factor [Pelomonas sp. V22]|uniref:response regulator n=1 Tax=Pelomonas sp. V22 TaxID=2822139 RepID=UPI0024A8961C|nr:response regulator transcription factor [Pelomonas sp. V22]MDI4635920.1 response regulator transcription factor [Pelomonas sp. V22]